MFWKYSHVSSSEMESLLTKPDVTLREIMDVEDVINECKVQNKQLVDILIKPEILHELVTLAISEPAVDADERFRYKYANIACEMITCDIPTLNESLAGDEEILEHLYAFLECEPPMNPLLASFFSKIMVVLIAKKTEQNWLSNRFTCIQVVDFLKAKENLVVHLLNHISTSAIMDLTLKLMTQVDGVEVRQNMLNYLDSHQMIQKLVALLDPQVESSKHNNIAQLLCDFLAMTKDGQMEKRDRNDSDPLRCALESPNTVALLLDHMLSSEKSESAIVSGITVLLELLDAKALDASIQPPISSHNIPEYTSFNNSTGSEKSDDERKEHVRKTTADEILKRLRDIHELLITPPAKPAIVTSVCKLDPPLGRTRLHVARLLATLIRVGGDELVRELIALGTFEVLIDLLFAYPWNNFLHSQVQACVFAALEFKPTSEHGDNNALSKHVLLNCKLIRRILDVWKDDQSSLRQGYMGHLARIANKIMASCAETPLEAALIEEAPELYEELKAFNDNILKEINRVHESLLGGVNPHPVEDSDDYGNIPFSASDAGSQVFSEYQNQQLTITNLFDSYGAHNDLQFDWEKESEDAIQSIESRSGMHFDLSEGNLVQQHELFKQVCAQNINTLDDSDDLIYEDKDHTFQTVIEKDADGNASSDSEEGDDILMEVTAPQEASEAPSIPMAEPWERHGESNDSPPVDKGPSYFDNSVFEKTNYQGTEGASNDPFGAGTPEGADEFAKVGWADFSVFDDGTGGSQGDAISATESHKSLKIADIATIIAGDNIVITTTGDAETIAEKKIPEQEFAQTPEPIKIKENETPPEVIEASSSDTFTTTAPAPAPAPAATADNGNLNN